MMLTFDECSASAFWLQHITSTAAAGRAPTTMPSQSSTVTMASVRRVSAQLSTQLACTAGWQAYS